MYCKNRSVSQKKFVYFFCKTSKKYWQDVGSISFQVMNPDWYLDPDQDQYPDPDRYTDTDPDPVLEKEKLEKS